MPCDLLKFKFAQKNLFFHILKTKIFSFHILTKGCVKIFFFNRLTSME